MSETQTEYHGTDQSSEQVRELTEDEFDPKGTLALTMLYFVLITLLWFFMYFVEFAEHGPSILS